ncbi:MAG TPA: 3-dehydroquinate synthase [Flavisolibacter sp.]|nr:3-dehydroquinate synthase [Flavisolibacter sp.]
MQKKSFQFAHATTDYYFDERFSNLKHLADPKKTVLVTDENLFSAHASKFKNWKTIVVAPGESNKVQATVDTIIDQLIAMEADRTFMLVGVGGGVITDMTGYVASVFMRGLSFGFVPTSILAMIDASIGGKNGIDVGVYKNMVGTIRQPKFILYDTRFLSTLPQDEWRGGFAEIIKHAAIKDAKMFRELEMNNLAVYQKKPASLAVLIRRNATLKTKVVQGDEFEEGDRKLLNFGHTLGHALENVHHLSHGEAVAIGMAFAAKLSQPFLTFKQADRVVSLIEQYHLPVSITYDKKQIFDILKSDKKRAAGGMNYVLLRRIGEGVVHKLPLEDIYKYM